MSTAELKNVLHKFIVETNDDNVLTQAAEYFRNLRTKNSDWWDELSEESRKAIEAGLKDLKNGNTHSSQDVRKSVRQRIENRSA